jgi:hypothetical protein
MIWPIRETKKSLMCGNTRVGGKIDIQTGRNQSNENSHDEENATQGRKYSAVVFFAGIKFVNSY